MSYDEFPDPFEKRAKNVLTTLLAAAVLAVCIAIFKFISTL
jgi:hypothetical protein